MGSLFFFWSSGEGLLAVALFFGLKTLKIPPKNVSTEFLPSFFFGGGSFLTTLFLDSIFGSCT